MIEPGLLMVEFLKWVADHPRSYDEAMEAWRSTCPRMTVWEDALVDGMIRLGEVSGRSEVFLTARGQAIIENDSHEAVAQQTLVDQSGLPFKRTA